MQITRGTAMSDQHHNQPATMCMTNFISYETKWERGLRLVCWLLFKLADN